MADFGTSKVLGAEEPSVNVMTSDLSNYSASMLVTSMGLTKGVGTPLWYEHYRLQPVISRCNRMAPEVIAGSKCKLRFSVFPPLLHAIDGEAADVYSFGIVLYEISAQRLPWSDLKGAFILNSLLEKVTAGERPKMPEGTPEAFASLAAECWATDPAARISFSEIVGRLQTQMKR